MNKYDYNRLTPFKWFILENFPLIDEDFDALTNWQLFCELGKEINKIINSENNIGTQMENVTNAFNTLQNYVDTYFENLDLTDEINAKLDTLVEDGTLTELIGNYVDPKLTEFENTINAQQTTLETNITNKVNAQDNLISQINAKVDSGVSGTPIPVSSTDDMTDTTKIYVLTTDGKWYYYDGNSWEIGGTYQSTGIDSEGVRYYNLNNNVIGDIYHYNGTGTYPGVTLELDKTYTGTAGSPLSITVKFDFKQISSTPAIMNFGGCTLNKTTHASTNTNRVALDSTSTYHYNFNKIEKTFNFAYSLNGFFLDLNTSTSQSYEMIFKNIEIYINNKKADIVFDSDYPRNNNVTVTTTKMNYLADKNYTDSKVNESIKNYERLDKKLLQNTYTYNGTGSYPTMYILLPKYYLNNETATIDFDCEVVADLQSELFVVGYGSYSPYTSTFATTYWVATNTNLNTLINNHATFSCTTAHGYNYLAIRINQSASKKYNFKLKDLKITISNKLIDYTFLSSNSTNWTESINDMTYLMTSKDINNLVFANSTAQYIDSLDKSNKYKIVCWGDSLTEGGTATGQPYPTILGTLLGDKYTVTNCGVSGQRSGGIAFRQGGIVWKNVSGFTIPSTTTDSVSFNISISDGNVKNIDNNQRFTVSINGILGTLVTSNTDSSNNVISGTFTRTTAGSETSVNADTQIKSVQDIYDDNTTIIWMGINDITFEFPFQSLGPANNAIQMVNHLSPSIKRFLIISVTSTASMTPESQLFGQVTALNNYYKTLFPNQFVDLEDYCVHQLIYDMGLTPTEDDLTNMENDIIPPSVTADNVHFTGDARVYIAQFIYNELAKRDWI